MSKVISLSHYKKKTPVTYPGIADDAIAEYMDWLYIQAGILQEAAYAAERFLTEMKLPPVLFKLDRNFADTYLAVNMKEFAKGEDTIEIAFRGIVNGTEYAVVIANECTDGDSIDEEIRFFKHAGEEWLIYDHQYESWERGPGEDIF